MQRNARKSNYCIVLLKVAGEGGYTVAVIVICGTGRAGRQAADRIAESAGPRVSKLTISKVLSNKITYHSQELT